MATATKARSPRKAATPANPVVTPEVAEALTPAVPVPPVDTPAEATPAMATPGAYTDADLEALVSQYLAVDKQEKENKDIVKQAREAFEDTRVLKSIVIWKVAMLEPYNGAPNATFAAKHLRMTQAEREALSPADLKEKAGKLKKAFTYYIRAGVALDNAGLALTMDTVDANMRKIVADAFKRTKDDSTDNAGGNGGGTGGEENGGGTPVPPAELPDPLTVADLLEHVSRLQATLALMVKADVPVSEAEAEHVGDTLSDFMTELTAYAAS